MTTLEMMPSMRTDGSVNRIDKYQIVKKLGEGSFGKVKLAYHLATNSRVALKIINRSTLAKSDMQGRVEREISYLRLLRHPHIIKLYEVIKSKDEIIMVMEFAGKELFDYIVQKGRMDENESRRFFQQIISAVDYCHRHKIVHRDLKPENLLLDENMDIKIADFGLSNIMTDGNFLKTSCGSPNYAAPEVISGRLYAGPEVDVWSCGVILYVMLCGRLPFDDESIPELFQKISSGTYTIPDYISPGARSLLRRMLVVDPLQRLDVEGIMQDPWFRVELPDYLLPHGGTEEDRVFTKSDEDVRTLSQKLGYTTDAVVNALNGEVPAMSSTSANEIRDAYRILWDNRRQTSNGHQEPDALDNYMASHTINPRSRHNSDASPGSLGPGSLTKSGIPVTFGFDAAHLNPVGVADSRIAILPSSLPQYHLAYMQTHGVPMSKKLSPVSVKKSKIRWHFGIRSRSYPLDVVSEIYRALKNLGAEWARHPNDDFWTINVRWRNEFPNVDGEPVTELLKMRIQLYQLEQNNYLVDFKFDGFENKAAKRRHDDMFSAYPFLRFATKLILELAVSSQQA